jgi:hypothetical protein
MVIVLLACEIYGLSHSDGRKKLCYWSQFHRLDESKTSKIGRNSEVADTKVGMKMD